MPNKLRRHGAAFVSLFTLIGALAGCGTASFGQEAAERTAPPVTNSPSVQPSASASSRASASPAVRSSSSARPSSTTRPSNTAQVNVEVNTTPDGTISPLIYGVAVKTWEEPWVDAAHLQTMGATVLRWGGNQTSRFNWEINATNSGSDWYFANASLEAGASPGATGDAFVQLAQAAGAEPLISIPALGYVARNGDSEARSSDVPEDGGTPIQEGSEAIEGYDPSANQTFTSIPSFATNDGTSSTPEMNDDAVYQNEWIEHLTSTWGTANNGGVRFYSLDNELDLWSNTHRDVHPARMGYDASLAMITEYAAAIKAVDPQAKIVGPDVSGAISLLYSELDRGDDNFATHADRLAHGDMPYLAWLLDQLRRHDERTGTRSIDVLSYHHYPQSGIYPEGDTAEQNALRLRSTQQLWNGGYTDESWLGDTELAQLELIPRLHELVDRYYPGLQIAITEWNYGNEEQINGGLAIVDVLGIFGREGLDMATYWTYPPAGTPGASAFQLFRNYDGQGGHFGDERLPTHSSDELRFAAYGSRNSETGDMLIATVNKQPNKPVEARFTLEGMHGNDVEVYQFSGEDTSIQRIADTRVENGALAYTVPPYAATLFVIKK
jgi:hypothetical protein